MLSNGGSQSSSLKVNGDPTWTRFAFFNLREQLNQNKPGWGFLRYSSVTTALFLVFMASAFYALVRAAGSVYSSEAVSWIAFVGAPFALMGLAFFGATIYGKMFPPFEIRESGKPSTRRTIVQTIGRIIGGLVVLLTIVQGIISIADHSP